MVPWKSLKFEVAKDVISCTLGAKQVEIKGHIRSNLVYLLALIAFKALINDGK